MDVRAGLTRGFMDGTREAHDDALMTKKVHKARESM